MCVASIVRLSPLAVVWNTLVVTLQYVRRSTDPDSVAVPEQIPHPAQSNKFVLANAAQVFVAQVPPNVQPQLAQFASLKPEQFFFVQ